MAQECAVGFAALFISNWEFANSKNVQIWTWPSMAGHLQGSSLQEPSGVPTSSGLCVYWSLTRRERRFWELDIICAQQKCPPADTSRPPVDKIAKIKLNPHEFSSNFNHFKYSDWPMRCLEQHHSFGMLGFISFMALKNTF